MSINRRVDLVSRIARKVLGNILFLRSNYFRFGRPVHLNEDISPFFIVGSGRSGNTLLRRILNNHDDLYIPPETYVLGKSIRQYLLKPYVSWGRIVKIVYNNFTNHAEFYSFGMDNVDSLINRMTLIPKEQQSLACLIDGFYREYASVHNIKSERWGDKTPLNTIFMQELKTVFPKALFVNIVRDPFDVVASYLKAGLYRNERDAVMRWVESIVAARIFQKIYPFGYYEVLYEDLVRKPEKVVRNVCEFLNVDFQLQMLTVGKNVVKMGDVSVLKHHENVKKNITTNSIGKWKRSLNNNQISNIKKILARNSQLIGSNWF